VTKAGGDLETRLAMILTEAPALMTVLRAARALDLPDWMVFSGAIYQPVWNHLTGRPLEHGLKDYDLAYFDAADLSYEAEDLVIRRAAESFDPAMRDLVEVRNQARVHLWFEDHFGEAYAPLASSAEALERFVAPTFAVGVRLLDDDQFRVFAPFGLDDLFAMRLAPNPGRRSRAYGKVAASIRERWPEIVVGS
jgi:hypothetical protein